MSSRDFGIPTAVSTTPPGRAASNAVLIARGSSVGSFVELEDADRVLTQELRPDVVAERHPWHVGEDALERQAHGEVSGVHDLVGAARVRVVDDVLGVVL